jgi:hypothetical protein
MPGGATTAVYRRPPWAVAKIGPWWRMRKKTFVIAFCVLASDFMFWLAS